MKTRIRINLYYAVSLTAVLALQLVSMTLAAHAENTIAADITGPVTVMTGEPVLVRYTIIADGTDSQAVCNASDSTSVVVNIHTPAGVTPTPAALTFMECDLAQVVRFEAAAPGEYAIAVDEYDNGTGHYATAPARFTLMVETPPDTTPPLVNYDITGIPGQAGWYTSKVFVDWIVTDPESAARRDPGCAGALVDYDTTGLTLTCRASSAGGSSEPVSVRIRRDATPPEIQLTGGPTHARSYSLGAVPPAPRCVARDAKSGLAGSCRVSGYGNTPGVHSLTAAAEDIAGNQAVVTVTYTVLP